MEGSSDQQTALSLHELLFDISDTLCAKYAGLDPFRIRQQRSGEVFKILFSILEKSRREKGLKPGEMTYIDGQGRTHIRRQSTDDNFF